MTNITKKNKAILIIAIAIFSLMLLIIIYGIYSHYNPIVMRAHSDNITNVESVQSIDNESDLVVKVCVLDKSKQFIEYTDDGTPYNGYTLTDVKITDVLTDGSNIEKNSEITILEPYYYYKVFNIQSYLMTIDDYCPLKVDSEYILYLEKAENVGDNVYFITGNEYGKYIINSAISDVNNDTDLTAEKLNINTASDHYKELYKDVMNKYLQK